MAPPGHDDTVKWVRGDINDPFVRLARIEEKAVAANDKLAEHGKKLDSIEGKLDKFVAEHVKADVSKVHGAYFKIIGALAVPVVGAVVYLLFELLKGKP